MIPAISLLKNFKSFYLSIKDGVDRVEKEARLSHPDTNLWLFVSCLLELKFSAVTDLFLF